MPFLSKKKKEENIIRKPVEIEEVPMGGMDLLEGITPPDEIPSTPIVSQEESVKDLERKLEQARMKAKIEEEKKKLQQEGMPRQQSPAVQYAMVPMSQFELLKEMWLMLNNLYNSHQQVITLLNEMNN